MWPQLPRAAAHREVHQQNQHELRQLNRTGLRQQLALDFYRLTILGGHQGCSNAVPMEPRLHYQVSSARAPSPDAPQGQHEAVSAPGGLHLLGVENFELGVEELACGGASSLKMAPITLNSPRRHPPVASII